MKMYIARDRDKKLCLYREKPFKGDSIFSCQCYDNARSWSEYFELDESLFPEVTWDNSPQEVVLEIPGRKKFTDEELDNPIIRDMTWKVDTPALLSEVANCSGQGIYSPVMAIFGRVLACVADRAAQLNDPILNIAMLKLNLYEVPHNELLTRIREQQKLIEDGEFTQH